MTNASPGPHRTPAAAEPPDEALVAAYVDGDEQAFDALVNRYQRRVYAICYRYFGDAEDAEDAAQDAFVALLRKAHTFSGASSFSTWMYRVATNACNDLARKRARRPQRSDGDISDRDALAGEDASAEQALADQQLPPELVAALRSLDAPTREAIVLHDVYGVPYHEIAERSGAALGTVKSRIHRGHARLVGLLGTQPTQPSDPDRPPTGQR